MKLKPSAAILSKSLSILLVTVLLFSFSTEIFAKKVKPNSVYVINLQGTLIERKEKDKFSDMLPMLLGMKPNITIGLNHVMKNIQAAAQNPNIVGIYLYNGNLSAGYAMMKEVRDALLKVDYEPVAGTPEQFAATISEDAARWARLVKASNFKVSS